MEKAKTIVGMIAIGVASGLIALKLYEVINKPKTAAPATVPGASAAAE